MTKEFWKAALIRSVRTMAQAALALIPAAVTITQVDWLTVLGTAALAGVVSVLTSIATGLPEAKDKPANDVRIVYLDEEGQEINPSDEAECHVTVKAYKKYDEDGSPIPDDGACAECDLAPYLEDDSKEGGDGNADR